MGEETNALNNKLNDESYPLEVVTTTINVGHTHTDDTETLYVAPEEDPQEIRGEIERTRSQMGHTIDAIQERLSPDHLKGQVKEEVKEQFNAAKEAVHDATIGKVENMVQNASYNVNQARYTVMDTIKHNPIPAAMVGLGLGWLLMNRRNTSARPPQYNTNNSYSRDTAYYGNSTPNYRGGQGWYPATASYNGSSVQPGPLDRAQQGASDILGKAKDKAGDLTDSVQQTASNLTDKAQQTASNLADTVQERASNFADTVQERASNFADTAQYQEQRLERSFQQLLQQSPLAVGAVALAIGAAVGFALPQTDRENEWLGETRDNFVDKAQEVAKDTMDKVQQVASKATDEVKNTVKEEAKNQGLTQNTDKIQTQQTQAKPASPPVKPAPYTGTSTTSNTSTQNSSNNSNYSA